MTRLVAVVVAAAYSLFVAGGLLTGVIGLSHLASLAQTSNIQSSGTPNLQSTVAGPALPKPTAQPAPAQPAGQTPVVVVAAKGAPTPASPPVDAGFAWSFLYVSQGDLWATGASVPTQLTQSGQLGQPALGENVLGFIERSRNTSDLWLASPGAPPQPITRDASSIISRNNWASQPVFVPGGQRVYVLGDFNKPTTGVGDLAVWELSLDQGKIVQITRPPAYAGGDQDVTIDPQNPQRIIFSRYAYAGTQLVEQLQWLDTSTEMVVPLTPPDQPSRQASYSPDGKEVAFVQRGDGSAENLYVARVQVSGKRAQLENVRQVATGVIAEPAWSPDGASLAYIALTSEKFQIWSQMIQRDVDGAETFGQPHQITTGLSVDATSRPVYMTREQADEVRQWLAQLAT